MKVLLNKCWVIYVTFLFGNVLNAQTSTPPPVLTVLENGDMLIGDQNKLTFELATYIQPNQVEPIIPDSVQGFEMRDKGKWELLQGKWTRVVVFTAWDSGAYYTPTFMFPVLRNGLTDTVMADRLPFLVSYPKDKDNIPARNKGIEKTEFTFEDAIPYLIGVVTVILLGLIFFLLRDRWGKKPVDMLVEPPIIITPFAQARAQLVALRDKQLWEKGEIKPYHTELTYILRDYLEKRYNIPALESTTDELLAMLSKTDMQMHVHNKLAQLLRMADLVKFAKVVPEDAVHERAYSTAMELLLETEPVETSSMPVATTQA